MIDCNHSRKKYDMTVIPTYNDSADVNGKRLLGIYKDEKQTRGRHGSMLKVAWNFCKTRVIVASIFYTLSTLSALCAPVVFLKMTLNSLENRTASQSFTNGTMSNASNTPNAMFNFYKFDLSFHERFESALYMILFAACTFMAKVFGSITNWLNLRTAIRLRSAVLSAQFRKCIKSSIVNNISSHQVLTDDVDNMLNLVDYLTKILGTVIAMVLALGKSFKISRGFN